MLLLKLPSISLAFSLWSVPRLLLELRLLIGLCSVARFLVSALGTFSMICPGLRLCRSLRYHAGSSSWGVGGGVSSSTMHVSYLGGPLSLAYPLRLAQVLLVWLQYLDKLSTTVLTFWGINPPTAQLDTTDEVPTPLKMQYKTSRYPQDL